MGFVIQVLPLCAQSDTTVTDPVSYAELVRKEFGLDQSLINGVQFYFTFQNTAGHPYFFNPDFKTGSLSLNGQVYNDVRLHYNIYFQHVDLEYKNYYGSSNRINLIDEFVDGFSFSDMHFERHDFEDGEYKFYQAIRTNRFVCYIFWEKGMEAVNDGSKFSSERRILFLEMVKGEVHSFGSIKEFSSFFPDKNQKEIRKYLRKNSLNFRNSSPEEIIENLNGVSDLLGEG